MYTAAYVPTATYPYIFQSPVILDFRSTPFSSVSFFSGIVAKSLVGIVDTPFLEAFDRGARLMFAIARTIGNEVVRKLLIIVANKVMHKNAATFVPWSIQICMFRWSNYTLTEVLVISPECWPSYSFQHSLPKKSAERDTTK